MRLCVDGADVAGPALGRPELSPQVLPGLSFVERPRLFAALVAAAQDAGNRTIDVIVDDRPGLVLLHPNDVRAVLRSGAQKGRPAGTMRAIQGHIATEGREFRRRRGAVMVALRAAASGSLPDGSTALDGSGDPIPDTTTLLLAHLSGAPCSPFLADLGRRALAATRTAMSADGSHEPIGHVYDEIEHVLAPSAPFVGELLNRGWTMTEIAAEVATLTFAGWASLAAVCRTARTVGVGGRDVTTSDITELLRIAPPGWLITRTTVEPLDLTTRLERIAPGTLVLMSPWLLHRDPTSWERPIEFDTTRCRTRDHPAYLPFGAGVRSCPAERYSREVLRLILALQPPVDRSPHPVPGLTDERSTCLVAQEDQPV